MAVAIQSTTLFDNDYLSRLHADLARLLVADGLFVDISETNDRVTDPGQENLVVYSRTEQDRIAIARAKGFRLIAKVQEPAHAVADPDRQIMVGMLFANRSLSHS